MKKELELLTRSETIIMKAIWDYDGDMPLLKLLERLNKDLEHEYARTTVATFLLKLSNKRYVSTEKEGRVAIIHPEVSCDTYCTLLFYKYLEFWYNGDVEAMVRALGESEGTSAEMKEKIARALRALDEE